MKTNVYLTTPAIVSALGSGLQHHIDALLNPADESPLTFSDQWVKNKNRAFGVVHETLRPFPESLPDVHRGRDNQLLWHALGQIENDIYAAIERFGAERIAVVMGTSTSGVDENLTMFQRVAEGGEWGEIPFNQEQQTLSAPADLVAEVYGLKNLCYVVSTACTSGARALISAARLLRAGLCDAVVCGGVDTLSPLTINGFASLEVLSDGLANPFSANRNGINIGEAAAVFIMTREADFGESLPLLGYGASSDAHHMSSPRPDGLGAVQAFQTALNHARMPSENVGWINLHGTGTLHNDSMESLAVHQVFGSRTSCTSTKPQTGHTLGAAGAVEAAFLWGIVSRRCNPEGKLPPQLWDGVHDTGLPAIGLTDQNSRWPHEKRIGASSSFAFGGSNAVIVIGEE
ncbi:MULTISPECIES: beta-ketoacyl-ACP synthase [unclassified Neisseria]|uniref:beta-ketoacyl-ACP synthase n=1 Tax=unclassified Neisseria TaxID=2623750 RepID=UPI0026657B6F|nr:MULTISPECIES: beta-ketoacyl-ACP synthase [unclassified Neisseria]MDO1509364.1 beta-ketoacyl-ACP synthase [Neisseria sp. MVDL19-042950]MDO1515357.1 beta-ketoacyl-ACP synthase [Neisseria sp. MVDL18-041461]MDO1562717.1 beta-ketoacyl-ACP synthase [Neisseria sp. MVDL20-010259]